MSITKQQIEQLKRNAANDALQALNDSVVVLDTETTGLDCYAEVIEVGAVNVDGSVAFSAFNNPILRIPQEASDIHGIYNRDVEKALYWGANSVLLSSAIDGRKVAIYNAEYDMKVIRQTETLYARYMENRPDSLNMHSAICVMKMYAAFWGDWNEARNSFRWQKLTNAAEQQGIEFTGKAHRALADAQVTLELLKRMADYADKAVSL